MSHAKMLALLDIDASIGLCYRRLSNGDLLVKHIRCLVVSLLAVALLMTAVSRVLAAKPDYVISVHVKPGKSVGQITLGATTAQVRHKLGAAQKTFTRSDGYSVDQWVGPKRPIHAGEDPEHTVLTAIYFKGKAVQIEWNSPKFADPSGVSTNSTLAAFYRTYGETGHHPKIKRSAYVYASEDREASHEYFDAPTYGICAQITGQDLALNFQITRLIVHAPGTQIIPDNGGETSTPMSISQ